MMDEVVHAESLVQESITGRDEALRKESSEREEPLIERMDRMMERLELLEQLVKKNSVPEGKIHLCSLRKLAFA